MQMVNVIQSGRWPKGMVLLRRRLKQEDYIGMDMYSCEERGVLRCKKVARPVDRGQVVHGRRRGDGGTASTMK